jgi:hypothetical protein
MLVFYVFRDAVQIVSCFAEPMHEFGFGAGWIYVTAIRTLWFDGIKRGATVETLDFFHSILRKNKWLPKTAWDKYKCKIET